MDRLRAMPSRLPLRQIAGQVPMTPAAAAADAGIELERPAAYATPTAGCTLRRRIACHYQGEIRWFILPRHLLPHWQQLTALL